MKHHKFSGSSLSRLENCHPDLVKVAHLALEESPYDFGITETIRSVEKQRQLVAEGKSWTMDSRHLGGADGLSRALDFAVYVDGKVTWDVKYYRPVVQAFFKGAIRLGIQIEAGALWRSVVDGPHVELERESYP